MLKQYIEQYLRRLGTEPTAVGQKRAVTNGSVSYRDSLPARDGGVGTVAVRLQPGTGSIRPGGSGQTRRRRHGAGIGATLLLTSVLMAGRGNARPRRNPLYTSTYYETKGNEALGAGRDQEAVQLFHKAIGLNPRDSNLYYNLGVAMARLHRYPEAIQALTRTVQLQPRDAIAYSLLSVMYRGTGNSEEAIEAAKKAAALAPRSAREVHMIGAAYLDAGRPAEAIPYLEQAIHLDHRRTDTYYSLGYAYVHSGQPDQAITPLQQCVALDPAYLDGRRSLAAAYLMTSQPLQAIACYSHVLAQKPRDADAVYHRSIAYLANQQGERAAADGIRYIRLKGWNDGLATYAAIFACLGWRQTGHSEQAGAILNQAAVHVGTRDAWPLAAIRYLRHEITAAEALALAGPNNLPQARVFIGVDQELSGQNQEALQNYHWVLDNVEVTRAAYPLAAAAVRRLQQ